MSGRGLRGTDRARWAFQYLRGSCAGRQRDLLLLNRQSPHVRPQVAEAWPWGRALSPHSPSRTGFYYRQPPIFFQSPKVAGTQTERPFPL